MSAIRGPTWSLRFYFSISQDRGLQVVRTPRSLLPSKIQIWTTTTSDSLSARARSYARARVRGSVRPGYTRVRAIGNGDQSPSNRGRTMRVAPPESGRLRERAIVATHVVSRALCRGLNVLSFVTFRVIQDCSFDRWCSPRDLPEISIRYLRTREASNDGRTRVPSEFPMTRMQSWI